MRKLDSQRWIVVMPRLVGLIVVASVVFPFSYVTGSLWVGTLGAILLALVNMPRNKTFVAVANGIAFGLGINALYYLFQHGLFVDSALRSFGLAFVTYFGFSLCLSAGNRIARGSSRDVFLIAGLLVAVFLFAIGIYLSGAGWFVSGELWLRIASLLGSVVGLLIGWGIGAPLGRWLSPGVYALSKIWPYIRVMSKPLIGFGFGYLTLIFVFAGYFWALWVNDHSSFNNLPSSPSFIDFFYFSTVTIATLGYGDITPASSGAKVVTCVEVIMGIGWITVGFAGVLAHLQPRFVMLAEKTLTESADVQER
jgi:hypothetical protein